MPIATSSIPKSSVTAESVSKPSKSITTIAHVHIINDPTLFNQHDYLKVSPELYHRLFPESQLDQSQLTQSYPSRYVLIKFLGVPDYFRHFKIFKISATDHESPTPNSVTFINNTNLARFGNQLTFSTCIIQSIDLSIIPRLERVFVGLPQQVYDILINKPTDSIKHNFIHQYLQHSGGVVTNDDRIRLLNGQVKLCEPLPQGLVDYDTNIILVKQVNDQLDQEYTFESDDEDDEDDEDDSQLDLSLYLASSMQLDVVSNGNIKTQVNFGVKPLPSPISIDWLPPQVSREDSTLFVFINNQDLIKLNTPIFNGDAAILKISSHQKFLVRIFTLLEPHNTFPLGHLYLSPFILLNAQLKPNSQVSIELVPHNQKLFQEIVPVAKSVTLARIASPITMDKTFQQGFLTGLKNSFQNCQKCVKQGDLIPIVIDSVLAKTSFDISNALIDQDEDLEELPLPKGDPDSVAWFLVTEVSGDDSLTQQFIIDPNQTTLTSSGLEFKRLPPNDFYQWYQYLNLPPVFNYSQVTGGTNFKYAAELKKIITTCMSTSNSSINLKTTILLNSMSRGLGKATIVRHLCCEMGLNLIELDAFELINPGAELKTVGVLQGRIDKLLVGESNQPDIDNGSFHVLFLRHIEGLCVQLNANEQGANVTTSLSLKIVQALNEYLEKHPNMIIIMSCNDIDKLNDSVRLMIKFQIDVSVPNEQERLEIFKFLINNELNKFIPTEVPDFTQDQEGFKNKSVDQFSFDKRQDITFQSLALQSAGLTPRDLISIVNKAKQLAIKRLLQFPQPLNELVQVGNGGLITWIPQDFNQAINDARNQFSDSIGAPRIPNVKWEDIGGLDLVKDEILDTIDMPLKHPELFNNGLKKRSGILFYGPPGTGKTLLAKAIATNFSLNFFSVKGPELLNMYIGESEANVRRVFQRARDAKPCVIFFDELDSVAPKRGNQGDSGGVMDRIVSQLLAELDGMSGGDNGDGVFVVGATNRPDLLDEALLRPGRFDKMLYLGISDTNDKQAKILEALTRKFKLADDVDLNQIAARCSFTYTGADFYALCSDSMLNAMTRRANEVDVKIKQMNEHLLEKGETPVNTRWWFDNVATEEDIEVVVGWQDFIKAQSEVVPSVSAEELQHYLRVRQNFEGGKQVDKQVKSDPQEIFKERVRDFVGEDISGIIDENGNLISINDE